MAKDAAIVPVTLFQDAAQTARTATFSVPFLLVLAYLFADYGRPQDWFPPLRSLHPGAITLGGGILALLVCRSFSIPRLGKLIFAFLIVMALGTLLAYNNYKAF